MAMIETLMGVITLDGEKTSRTITEHVTARYDSTPGYERLSLQAGNLTIQVPAKELSRMMEEQR